MLITETLSDILARIERNENFVLNIIAEWCPDCMEEQKPVFHHFVESMQADTTIPVIELIAQIERRESVDAEIERFVESLGGHGFPRTVLFKAGKAIDSENVEIIRVDQLNALANKFQSLLKAD